MKVHTSWTGEDGTEYAITGEAIRFVGEPREEGWEIEIDHVISPDGEVSYAEFLKIAGQQVIREICDQLAYAADGQMEPDGDADYDSKNEK